MVELESMKPFETSSTQKELSKALRVFHDNMGIVAKTSKNPFFKSNYADLPTILDAIHEPMKTAELAIHHHPIGKNMLLSRLVHSKSGEWVQSIYEMTPTKNDPQGAGSVITYQMRYAVGAILGLSIDKDDDGNHASGRKVAKAPVVLEDMTKTVKDSMLKYIDNGKSASVVKKMSKYADSDFKKEVQSKLDKQ